MAARPPDMDVNHNNPAAVAANAAPSHLRDAEPRSLEAAQAEIVIRATELPITGMETLRSLELVGGAQAGTSRLSEPVGGVLTARCESFRSLTSYGSFRSCHTYKSVGGTSGRSRTSFKSAISRWTNKEGVDNQVFYECTDHADTVSYKSCQEGRLEQTVQDLPGNREVPTGDPKKPLLSAYSMYLGYLFSVLAGLTFTASNVLVKLVPRLDPWVLLLFRAGLQLLLMVPVLGYYRANPLGPRPHRVKIYLQGLIGGLLPVAIYFAVRRLPLGDAATIFFSAPVCTLILSSIILREHCGLYRILIIAMMVAGVLLLCRPTLLFTQAAVAEVASPLLSTEQTAEHVADPTHPAAIKDLEMPSSYYTSFHQLLQFNLLGWPIGVNFAQVNKTELPEVLQVPAPPPGGGGDEEGRSARDPVGLAAAFAVPALTACLALLTRQCRDVPCTVLVFWFGAGALVVSIIGLCTLGHLQISYGTQEWVLTALIALLGIAGNLIMTKALCWLKPGKVMILRSSEIVAAYILQISVFKTVPVWLDLGGSLLVLTSVVLMGVEHLVMTRVKWRFF